MLENHSADCVLSRDHYGPCATVNSEFFIADEAGNVLWRADNPNPNVPWSDDPESEFQKTILPAYRAIREACVQAAFALGYLPFFRHHSRYIDAVTWPIKVEEIEERRDLLLHLPMGKYRLKAKRARQGEQTSEQTIAFGGQAIGVGSIATTDNESKPVFLHGNVSLQPNGDVWLQPSSIQYEDGTSSGFLGCYPRDIFKVEDR